SGQSVQTVVRNFCNTDVRFAWVCMRLDVSLCEDPEQRCLAHLRQADDAGFHFAFDCSAFDSSVVMLTIHCHPERGRTPESKDPAYARIGTAAARHSPRAVGWFP